MLVLDLCEEPDVDMVPIVTHLRSGGLVAYPTETVYGIGGVCSIEASMRVRELKDREETKPLIALVPNRESVVELEWTPEAVELAETFWPGSLTWFFETPMALSRQCAGFGQGLWRCARALTAWYPIWFET